MNWFSFFKLPSRIAAILAGVGVLGGFLAPGSAEAGYRKVPEKYQDVDVKVLQSGPTLLFSDSPEMVYENGILYKDIVEGEGRVFFHHVNGTKNTRKLAIPLTHMPFSRRQKSVSVSFTCMMFCAQTAASA